MAERLFNRSSWRKREEKRGREKVAALWQHKKATEEGGKSKMDAPSF